MSPIGSGGSSGGGGSSFNGGLIACEVSADITLVDGVPSVCSFDVLFSTSVDVTLGVDNKTLTCHTTGWYTVWYSFAVKASATTVKSQVEMQINVSDNLNWIPQTSIGEVQLHLDGAVSLRDMVVPYTSPPVHFTAADSLQFKATAYYTVGSVGDALCSSNTYASLVRIA